jgi:4-amino-4-deoxy-L-arabinose transferase-like glycosyltransferase
MTAASSEPPGEPRAERLLWWLLQALAAAALLLLGAMVALRIGHPFELEWMEGAMVDEAARVRQGLPTYHAPGVDHAPFLYTPLLYWLGAAAMALLGEGFAALRWCSVLATAACIGLVFACTRRETSDRRAAFAAAGLFAAGYGWLRSWYDLGRNDMVFLACMLAAVRLLQQRTGRTAVAAGVALALAFLAKQTALLWLPPLLLSVAVVDWRRAAWFGASAGAATLCAIAALHVGSDGWSTFYVFTMPLAHGRAGDRWLGFFVEDLVPVLPLLLAWLALAALRWRAGRRREAWALLFGCGGALFTSYASRLHVGGYDNVLVYGFAGLCIAAPALAVEPSSRRTRRVGAALLTAQFVCLAVDLRAAWANRSVLLYDPGAWVPTEAHRHASAQLVEFARAQPGGVWLPFHGHLATMAGKSAGAHGQALADLMVHVAHVARVAPDDRAAAALASSFEREVAERRLSAIVLDVPYGPVFEDLFARYLTGYARRPGDLIDAPAALRPLVGMVTDSPYALVPR